VSLSICFLFVFSNLKKVFANAFRICNDLSIKGHKVPISDKA
jgi:hypothetical protein